MAQTCGKQEEKRENLHGPAEKTADDQRRQLARTPRVNSKFGMRGKWTMQFYPMGIADREAKAVVAPQKEAVIGAALILPQQNQ